MLEGYSKNLYGLLRRYLKLPRPDEIWRDVPNKWGIWQMFLYADMALSVPLAYAQKPMSIVNTIIGLLILLEIKQVASTSIVVIAGVILFFLLLIAGHIMIVMGVIKRGAELQNSQSPDIIEIRNNVRKLVKEPWKCKLRDCDNPKYNLAEFCVLHLDSKRDLSMYL